MQDDAFYAALRGPTDESVVIVESPAGDEADSEHDDGGASRRQRRAQRRQDKSARKEQQRAERDDERQGRKQHRRDRSEAAERQGHEVGDRPTAGLAPVELLQGHRARRRSPVRGVFVALLLIALAGAVVVAVVTQYDAGALFDRARDLVAPSSDDEAAPIGDDPQPILAMATYLDNGGNGTLRGLTVLAHDRARDETTVLLVPISTVVDVPGYGSFSFVEAWRFGGPSLIGLTLENLLGIRLDGVVAVAREDWEAWLTRVGGAEVDVRTPIVASDGPLSGQTRFEAGTQFLDGARMAEYLTVRSQGETELEALARANQVMARLLDGMATDEQVRDSVLQLAGQLPSTAPPGRLAVVLDALAQSRRDDRLSVLTLPVSPLGASQEDIYRYDRERAEVLVADRFGPSMIEGVGVGRSVQILNGNGRPGVGRQVTEILADGGYRVLLTGNADRFDHPTTRILVYDGQPETLRLARDVRDRLGVGVIEQSATPQSVVDVTIIVGMDFLP